MFNDTPMTADHIADDFSCQIESNPDENEWTYPWTFPEGLLPLYLDAKKLLQECYGTLAVEVEVVEKDTETNKIVYGLKVKR